MKKTPMILSVLCIILLLSCGTKGSVHKANSAQDFTLNSVSGEAISLSSYKGNVVVIDFWATWCPPCQRSIPVLIELYNKYHARGFTVLGISTSDSEDILKTFMKTNSIPYPILFGTNEVAKNYGVRGIPHMVIIDKKGRISKTQVGYYEQMEMMFDKIIDSLLSE